MEISWIEFLKMLLNKKKIDDEKHDASKEKEMIQLEK
jgi:hypothetical protein